MSEATHADATAAVLKLPIVQLVVELAVCLVINTVADCVVKSKQLHTQPAVAVGNPITPDVATPPVPTLTVNAAVPLFVAIEGLVPNPELIVGAVLNTIGLELLRYEAPVPVGLT